MNQSSSRALAALILGIATTLVGCSDSSEPSVPGSLQVLAGDTQTAAAGSVVPIAPAVKLLTTTGKPLGGAQVTFASSADGVVTPAQVTTNAQGVAALTSWTLPKRAGSHQLTVSSTGVSPVTITATAAAGAPAKVFAASPENQTGIVGAVAGAAPAVRVTDVHDNPVAGIAVRFTPSGNGSVGVVNATTDADGVARSERWTLSTIAGPQILRADFISNPALGGLTFNADVSPAPAFKLAVVAQPVAGDGAGSRLTVPPIVEVRDNFDNRIAGATMPITASIAAGSTQTLSGTTTVLPLNGRATFNDLTVNGPGTLALQFTAGGLIGTSSASFNVTTSGQCVGNQLTLNYQLGQSVRFAGTTTPACIDFGASTAGQQYLVQFENVSAIGPSSLAIFPGAFTLVDPMTISLSTRGISGNVASAREVVVQVPRDAVHSWDFGAGEIYEIQPPISMGMSAKAYVVRNNTMVDASAANANIAVGDTVSALLVGIPRLGIADGTQKAVVRYSGPDLIIAEDIRLPTLPRQGGGFNTPLTLADMEAIAADYAKYAKVQADLFFNGRHNAAVEGNGSRPIAIHTLMYQDNIWGYTFPNGNFFAWDFWVGSNGATKGINQTIERNSNNLFMHEIAHMRHAGLNERAGKVRGNTWLVEGFARHSERWPIAMRLLNTAEFSRTGNIVLPGYTSSSTLNSLEDVPTYVTTSQSLYSGYAASSYVFDYFADQVAKSGNPNWRAALADFLVHAGTQSDLNAAIGRYLPGVDFGTLFTRARIALYLDDFAPGLPDWTQFHQYQLRASRMTANPQNDPRNMWRQIAPGASFTDAREVLPGAAFGYIIDGTAGTAPTRLTIDMPRGANNIVSITRIR
jgi:hypothetical protein